MLILNVEICLRINERLMEIKTTFVKKGEKKLFMSKLFFNFPKSSHNHLKIKKYHRMFCNIGLPPKDETVKTT